MTKRMVAGFVAGCLLWGPAFCFGGSEPIQDFRLWARVYLNFPVSGPVKGYMEANPRFSDNASQIDQLLLRPAVGYQLTSTISLWQGYAWVANYQPNYKQEHRIFQQTHLQQQIFNIQIAQPLPSRRTVDPKRHWDSRSRPDHAPRGFPATGLSGSGPRCL